jgi:hypothetical protein
VAVSGTALAAAEVSSIGSSSVGVFMIRSLIGPGASIRWPSWGR